MSAQYSRYREVSEEGRDKPNLNVHDLEMKFVK